MKSVARKKRWLVAIILFVGIAACSDVSYLDNTAVNKDPPVKEVNLDVYKSQACLCCGQWVAHVEVSGFATELHHPADLNKLKSDKGISPRYQSCHTAISKDGYVFEGHIPADIIQRFLANPPSDAIGLAVPGMPVGSPGMEMGNRYDEYDVFLLNKDGNDKVYEHIGVSD
jgi:hypothetical protein